MGKDEAEPAIGLGRVNSVHIKKRSLKNKALSIGFNDKDLKDFVSGFHKRKKKRRKEAQQQIQEKLRLKRIEKRRQRKEERAFVQGGGAVEADGSEAESGDLDEDEETEPKVPLADTKVYDAGELTVMVTTSEISREDEIKQKPVPRPNGETGKKHNVPVKKKPLKTPSKQRRSGPKPQKKREKRKGKISKTYQT